MTREELLQVAKPILFNTDMVRAILDGRKTETRRVIKLKYDNTHHEIKTDKYGTRLIEIQDDVKGETFGIREDGTSWRKIRPYIEPKAPYKKGDILYVRETWGEGYEEGTYIYKADDKLANLPEFKESSKLIYHPSIHMPKEAARIWIKVKDVRVERLKDMTDKDALNEGAQGVKCDHAGLGVYGCTDCMNTGRLEPPILEFMGIWNSTIKKSDIDRYGWDAYPWVWVIEFERISV